MELDELWTQEDWDELKDSFDILHPPSTKDDSTLSKRQKLVAYALSLGWSPKKAAENSGVKYKTVNRWTKDKDFQQFMAACEYTNGIGAVQDYLKERIVALTRVLDQFATKPSARVKPELQFQAAKTLFHQVLGEAKQTHEVTSLRDIYKAIEKSPKVKGNKLVLPDTDDDEVH